MSTARADTDDTDTLEAGPSARTCIAPGCAELLPDRRFRYCPEHVHLSAHRGPRARSGPPGGRGPEVIDATSTPAGASRPVGRGKNPSATGTVAKLLVVGTLLWMRADVRRRGIPDHDGLIAEALSLDSRESVTIARPVARMIDTNATASRLLGPVVRNEDVLAAAMAVMDWQHRVRVTLDQIATNGPGNVTGPGAPRARPVRDTAADRSSPDGDDDGPDLSAYRATPEPLTFGVNGQIYQPPS